MARSIGGGVYEKVHKMKLLQSSGAARGVPAKETHCAADAPITLGLRDCLTIGVLRAQAALRFQNKLQHYCIIRQRRGLHIYTSNPIPPRCP